MNLTLLPHLAALSLLVTLGTLGGCAAVPPVSGPTLSVAEVRQAQLGGEAGSESDSATGEPTDGGASDTALVVRWGGTIADVRNRADGSTVLEIVSRPLRAGGRPRGGDVTDGRFLAEVDTFLDPAIVTAGREVTVVGRVAGGREGRVGEMSYRFPVVAVDDYRYWKPEPPPAHFPHPGPHGDPHDGFLHDWPHSVHHPHRRPRRFGGGASVLGTVSF